MSRDTKGLGRTPPSAAKSGQAIRLTTAPGMLDPHPVEVPAAREPMAHGETLLVELCQKRFREMTAMRAPG